MDYTRNITMAPGNRGENLTVHHNSTLEEDEIPKGIKLSILIIVSLAVTISNIFNLIVLKKTRQIPSIAKICLLNLSVADLMVGVVVFLPCTVAVILGFWPYGGVWCQISGILHGGCCAVSVYSMTVVSVDRYLAIKKPLRYPILMTTKRCVTALVLLWCLGTSVFLAHMLVNGGDFLYYKYDRLTGMCGLHYYWQVTWLGILGIVLIPGISAAIIVYTSAAIIREAVFKTAPVALGITKKTTDLRAVKILCLTTAVYFIAWGPFVSAALVKSVNKNVNIPPILQFSLLWLSNSNSFMNVFIYSMIYRSFRMRLKRLILHVCFCSKSSNIVPQNSEA